MQEALASVISQSFSKNVEPCLWTTYRKSLKAEAIQKGLQLIVRASIQQRSRT